MCLHRWVWAHPRMLHPATWRQAVPPNMRRLPRPLAGHCAVDIRDNISTVLTTFTMLTPCILCSLVLSTFLFWAAAPTRLISSG